ncbi:MAG TPA: diheme cytochrome c-553 [Thermoanaerobaculia bacterium]|nr:diheme cytochrome c-553 [Thermoanaerobaculia bacterium]
MNTRQRVTVIAVIVLAVAAAVTLTATASNRAAQKNEQAAKAAIQARIKRGEYLVTVVGCHDCHTPFKMGPKGPEPDMSRALSGHPESLKLPAPPKLNGQWMWTAAGTNTAFAGPWGISYTANLTPERLTGIGIWDEAMFVRTIRTGRHWGVGRPILPPMPWQAFSKMTDEDLKSIYAYLRTVKPIKNQVPDAIVAPPPSAPKAGA